MSVCFLANRIQRMFGHTHTHICSSLADMFDLYSLRFYFLQHKYTWTKGELVLVFDSARFASIGVPLDNANIWFYAVMVVVVVGLVKRSVWKNDDMFDVQHAFCLFSLAVGRFLSIHTVRAHFIVYMKTPT